MATVEATPAALSVAADETRLIEELRSREGARMPQRDRLVAWLTCGVFLAGAGALAATAATPPLATSLLLIAVYALVSRVNFEVGSGWAVPTELVLIPMLIVLPPALVPLYVAAAVVLAWAPEFVRRRFPVDRLPLEVGSASHALGPALVLALAKPEHAWKAWPVYAAALAAQLAADFAATAPWSRVSYGIRPLAHLREMRWSFMVDASLAPVGLLIAFAAAGRPVEILVVLPLVGLLAFFARERQMRIDHTLELSHAYRGTAFLLGDVIEADDAYTGSHSRDVVELTLAVADQLRLDASARHEAELVALLHDVGKVRIPAEIINKPGPLDAEERALMNMHTIEGERMLEQVGGLLGRVGKLVRSCHERWDGGGYPDGLAREEIPLVARIVCCCDAYNAMTTDRSYRSALSLEEAREELVRNRRTQFDPQVVDALLAVTASSR
jgi:HD-GYP domain-containing protein (c-di-GMP phosphodiesterase class II)